MPVYDESQAKRGARIAGAWGVFTGILCGIVFMGIVYDRHIERDRARVSDLLACDPSANEQSVLRRDASGQLSCDKQPMQQRHHERRRAHENDRTGV